MQFIENDDGIFLLDQGSREQPCLETKLEIIRRLSLGHSHSKIAEDFQMPKATVLYISHNQQKLLVKIDQNSCAGDQVGDASSSLQSTAPSWQREGLGDAMSLAKQKAKHHSLCLFLCVC